MRRQGLIWILLVVIIMLGYGMRLYGLDRQALRGDEAFTAQYWMMVPLDQTIEQQLTVDPQPLLAYAVFNAWGHHVGLSPFVARMLPVLVGTLGIAAMFGFARRSSGQVWVGVFAALMWAIHPFLVWHSQDLRNYALWSSWSAIAIWLGLCAIQRRRRVDWLLFVGATTIAGYLYYLDIFVVIGLSLFVVVTRWGRWRLLVNWGLSMGTVGLLLAPWYLQPRLLSGGDYGGTTTGFNVNKLLTEFPNMLMFGPALPAAFSPWLWVILWLVFIASFVWLFWRAREQAILYVMVGFLPLILLAFVSVRLNVFAPRYVLGSLPAWVALLSAGIIWAVQQRWVIWRVLGLGVALTWVSLSSVALFNYHTDYAKSPDWQVLTTYLSNHVTADQLVVQAAADASFGYYYHHVHDIGADERALPASPQQSPEDIERELQMASQQYDAIWIVAQGFTDWPNYGVVETWLDGHMQRVIDTNANGLRIQQYKNWQAPPPNTDPIVRFDDIAEITHIETLPVQPTGEIIIWVYWRPLAQTESPFKVFTHLAGPANPATGTQLWRQDDQQPQNGKAPTTQWEVGAIYRDVYVLPDTNSLPNGEYTLQIGMYNATTGERALTENGADTYRFNQITR